jgi:Transposase, Mutator family
VPLEVPPNASQQTPITTASTPRTQPREEVRAYRELLGLSRQQRCFRRFQLVGLGGREPVAEGYREGVQGWLPAHGPPCPPGPGRVKGAGDVKPIYTAVNASAARAALDELTEKWGQRYGAVIRLWENAWNEFIPFLDYDLEIRKLICSTNAIESLNARYRRAVKARGHFPTEQAVCGGLDRALLDQRGRTGIGVFGVLVFSGRAGYWTLG